MLLVTTEEMRELDRLTIAGGIPGDVLMERAGAGVAAVIERDHQAAASRGVLVLCGKGNNGGDGFVVARLLAAQGYAATAVLLGERAAVSGDAATNLQRWLEVGGRLVELTSRDGLAALSASLREAGLVVDALLGTGLRADVAGLVAGVIELLATEAGGRPVVAVDLPSGLDGDSGAPHGIAVNASHTVTLGAAKIGLLQAAAWPYVGRLDVVDIGLSAAAVAQVAPSACAATAETMRGLVPRRSRIDHKGSSGHVLVVGGALGKSGAAALAARSALRAGAGLVTVACPAGVLPMIAASLPEAMTDAVGAPAAAFLADDGGFAARIEGRQAVVIGPGVGRHADTALLVRRLAATCSIPVVIDADGLNALGIDGPRILGQATRETVLTPHPGEMARLLGSTVPEVQRDRVEVARSLAAAAHAIVVLKGPATVTASPDGRVTVNTTGGPLLGVGGTGDVLAGLVGALLAQGLPAYDAARLGAFLHGLAGDRLARRLGDSGLLASELADELPVVRRRLVQRRASA